MTSPIINIVVTMPFIAVNDNLAFLAEAFLGLGFASKEGLTVGGGEFFWDIAFPQNEQNVILPGLFLPQEGQNIVSSSILLTMRIEKLFLT